MSTEQIVKGVVNSDARNCVKEPKTITPKSNSKSSSTSDNRYCTEESPSKSFELVNVETFLETQYKEDAT